jgi:hypothetical protein
MSKSSPTKLPSFWAIALGVGVVSVLIAIFGNKNTLECSRISLSTSQCEIKNYNLFTLDRVVTIPLKDIKQVDIVSNGDEDSDPSPQLVLVTNKEEEIAIGSAGDYENQDQIAAQIAWFLENPTATTFNFTDGNQTFAWGLFSIFSILLSIYLYQLVRSIRDRFKSG